MEILLLSGFNVIWSSSDEVTVGYYDGQRMGEPYVIGVRGEDALYELITGTHGTTATATWTGTSEKLYKLENGTCIQFKLTSAGASNVTLNLKLADGTITGAIPVYYNNTTRLSTQYGVGAVVQLVYDGTSWRVLNPYANDPNYRVRHISAIKALAAITAGHLIAGTASGYKQLAAGLTFDLSYPILYASSAISANATATNTYETYDATFSTTGTIESGAANKMLYLKGTVTNNTFTIASSNWLTTVIPTAATDPPTYYIPLGVMSSATAGFFSTSNRLYSFLGDAFQPIDSASSIQLNYVNNLLLDTVPVVENHSSMLAKMEDEILTKVETDYVSASDFATYQQSVSTQFDQTSQDITMQVTNARNASIGDIGNWTSEWSKYFRFDANGLHIGEEGDGASNLTLRVDGSIISFMKGGQQIAYWDGDTLHTGNIYIDVSQQARFGNFAFVPRSDGSLMFLKVGG